MHKLLTTLKDVTATVRAIFPARPQWRVPALLLLLTAVLWPVDPAWAQALTPIVTVANNIATVLTGPFGVSVATIGLVACGFLAMAGRMPWSAAIAVIAGIILVFGAATIVTEIRGVAN